MMSEQNKTKQNKTKSLLSLYDRGGRQGLLIVGFLLALGYSLLTNKNLESSYLMKDGWNHVDKFQSQILSEQISLQAKFQELIRKNQHRSEDCSKQRAIMADSKPDGFDGFTNELQYAGYQLMVAMATDRMLVLPETYVSAYTPHGCHWPESNTTQTYTNGWDCLYEPLSNCTETLVDRNSSNSKLIQGTLQGNQGIVNDHKESDYFHSRYYGRKRVVEIHDHQFRRHQIDCVQNWERSMGRYWIRSQMAHYLWKPSLGLRREMLLRLPHELLETIPSSVSDPTLRKKERYIGIHIRYSDNIDSFLRDFGRDAQILRQVKRFMDIAQSIREDTGISTIYLATDSKHKLDEMISSNYNASGWTLYFQPDQNVPRATDIQQDQWMWFRNSRSSSAAAIAADLEVLRRADYLIGSFQSNVFRLAAELNTAQHAGIYPWHMNRHQSVDVEWYEDP